VFPGHTFASAMAGGLITRYATGMS
jgi:hypothetical protein